MYYDIEQGWLLQEGAHSHVETFQADQIGLYCGREPNSATSNELVVAVNRCPPIKLFHSINLIWNPHVL